MMTPERWQQIDELLQTTLDLPERERAAVLTAECAGDAELQSEAASLISAYENAGDFLEEPALAVDGPFLFETFDARIGHVIGPYHILERLGAGGMGEVYLAQDGRLNRRVALKILPTYFAGDDERLTRFEREARAVSALNHPNILTIYEVGEEDGVRYIATEYIEGQTLRDVIGLPDLSLQEIFDVAEQVASALSAAHAAGVVHRDIKPENIMRRSDGLVKILDFGIAKLSEQPGVDAIGSARMETEAGVVLGTVDYMSPEQARALDVDGRTDIWSLGVVLYELLTGRRPFAGKTRIDSMVSILEREPAAIVQTSNDPREGLLREITMRALRKDRDERYPTADDMLLDLRGMREMPFSSGASVSKPAGSFRHAILTFGPALLVIALVVGVFAFRNRIDSSRSAGVVSAPSAGKTYPQMSEAEQIGFIREQEQRVSRMMGDRPVKLDDDAVLAIKRHVDWYVTRMDASKYPEDRRLSALYLRAQPYVPLIARAFEARKVPVIIGIYLPVIESAYYECYENESNGAKGLYQFIPQTAKIYGVANDEMCDVHKMTPAAAHYIADRMAELGEDSQSMTLVLLSYNRGAESVRDSLRVLRDSDHYERNFWMLFRNRDKLDETFRNESAGYVPAFLAAAIIGENPKQFELPVPPLSTLARQ